MHPVTDPSMQGMGTTPSFLVEGTWVVGFFTDAKEKQQPIIMGTLPNYPQTVSDKSKGFNDPNEFIPRKKIVYLVMHSMSLMLIDLHEMILTKSTRNRKNKR